ncbi:hypothetical protein SAMD00019534_032540, partial [Acytostelium subglobosum LB1]|uniref:hypothetical protein n=1 Tax=Acytostelium subglobosum LB1 TaxID=1410327 RepID=UPI000644D043
MLFRTIIKTLWTKSTDIKFIQLSFSVRTTIAMKYDHWVDAAEIIEYNHFGLLRDRLKRNLYIKYAPERANNMVCRANKIDGDTFAALYNRYQVHFKHYKEYKMAIKWDNLVVVKTLLHQTYPVAFPRNNKLLIHATKSLSYTVLKYLIDSGLFDCSVLYRPQLEEDDPSIKHVSWSSVFANSPESVRYLLDPGNFDQTFIDLVRRNACQHVEFIMMRGDKQLIDDLLFDALGKPLFGDQPINSQMMLLEATPEEQLAHFLRFLPLDNTRVERASVPLDVNSNDILSMVKDSIPEYIQIDPTLTTKAVALSHDQLLVYRMLFQMEIEWRNHISGDSLVSIIVRHYLKTGDCQLLPMLFHSPPWIVPSEFHKYISGLFNLLINYGNVAQTAIIYTLLAQLLQTNHLQDLMTVFFDPTMMYHSFASAKDVAKSFQVVRYLNARHVVQTDMGVLCRKFLGTPEMLQFLLSDASTIFSKDLIISNTFFGISHIEYIVRNRPEIMRLVHHNDHLILFLAFFGPTNNELLTQLLDLLTPEQLLANSAKGRVQTAIVASAMSNLDLINVIAKKIQLNRDKVASKVGRVGDVALFQAVLAHIVAPEGEDLETTRQSFISSVLEKAIDLHQMALVKHIFEQFGDLVLSARSYIGTTAAHGNMEMLAYLWQVDKYEEMAKLTKDAINGGQIQALDWLLNQADKVTYDRIKAHPININDLIVNHYIDMLRHLIDIGATLDLSTVDKLPEYQNNPSIQSLVAQYKEQRDNNLKRMNDGS